MAELGLRTTAGIGFPLLRSDTIDLLLVETRDRFSDVWLGTPGVFEEEYTMPGARVVGRENIGCNLEYDGVKLTRSIRTGARGVMIKSRVEVKRSMISNESLKSKQYADFQKQVRRCFNRSAVILSLKPSPAALSNSSRESRSN
jgi:hypothetical protein